MARPPRTNMYSTTVAPSGAKRSRGAFSRRLAGKAWREGLSARAFGPRSRRRGSQRVGAARHGDDAGAGDIDQAEPAHQADEGLHLVGGAGDLEDEGIGLGVDHLGAEDVGQSQRLDALVARALDL